MIHQKTREEVSSRFDIPITSLKIGTFLVFGHNPQAYDTLEKAIEEAEYLLKTKPSIGRDYYEIIEIIAGGREKHPLRWLAHLSIPENLNRFGFTSTKSGENDTTRNIFKDGEILFSGSVNEAINFLHLAEITRD